MKTKHTLASLYSFPGFRANCRLSGIFGDPHARVITLTRRQKKVSALHAASLRVDSMTVESTESAMWTPQVPASIWTLNTEGYSANTAGW